MQFLDLPMEILPEILYYVIKPHHLACACLVSNTFRTFAVPLLYENIRIYSWHREGKTKVMMLFDTLARHAYLALLVKRMEIRDFPKAKTILDTDVLNHVLRGLKNCANLSACTWTRDGSLSSEILEILTGCSQMRELEINGHDQGNYDPQLLLSFTKLKRISLIMPSAAVLAQLNPWLSLIAPTLKSFTLICMASSLVTDALLESIAPQLVNLEYLHLAGCPKLTEKGVWSVVGSNQSGLLGLGLEGVSQKFDMQVFAQESLASGALNRLRSITLTINHHLDIQTWVNAVIQLISRSPIEFFQIYSTGVFFESPVTDDLWNQLISTHGSRLVRFSVHRMLISLECVQRVCKHCPNLEQLFIVMEPQSLGQLAGFLTSAKKLRTLHINYPSEARSDGVFPIMRPQEALDLVRECPTIAQLGCNTRVWQISRRINRLDDGEIHVEPFLSGYESTEIPEQFLVVRT